EVMELDGKGFPQPTGRMERLAADTLILAVGQDAGTGVLRRVPGVGFKADGEPVERGADFAEIVGGLSQAEAVFEAQRCLSCGNCFECDGCLGSCPEDAVVKLGVGHRYRYDYDRCTGCGTCYEQCPVHAIEMIGEPG